MKIIKDTKTLISYKKSLGAAKLALVPTMGALHDGHLSLVKKARAAADLVMVTIFVNPLQFGKNEDLKKYPRTEKHDLALLKKHNVDVVFMPAAAEIYPENFASKITISGLSDALCGKFRPGHFSGVATVVAKLFALIRPDFAVFGEKDFQQLQIIRRLVRDLNFDIEIIPGAIMREKSGLALSSRNAYLSEKERKIAPILYKNLVDIREKIKAGAGVELTIKAAKSALLKAGFSKIDYIELVDSATLKSLAKPQKSGRIVAAAYLGKTRLIDNIEI